MHACTFAFGEVGGPWGIARFLLTDDGHGKLLLGLGERCSVLEGSLERDRDEEEWRVAAEGSRLVLTAPGPSAADQLCRVEGTLSLPGQTREVSLGGWRHLQSGPAGIEWSSMRLLAAWFSSEEGLAVSALRPRGASSQIDDVVHAEMLGAGAAVVEEPRLSTTYLADGTPSRAGLELWLGRPDDDELYPVRAAGEGVGPAASWEESGLLITARLLRWHSRGSLGTGVYVLGRRRS